MIRTVAIAAKLVAIGLAFVAILPAQALGLWLGCGLAGRLPMALHRLFLRLFDVRVVVRGMPPADAPTLVLANHVSWLDIPVIGSLRPVSFIAKSEIAGWPIFGLLAKLQRSVFVDRTRRGATAEVNAAVARRLARGEAIVLFAEGTTGDGNRVLPFRSSLVGAARAALADPGLDRITLQPLAVTYVRRNGLPVTRRERPEIAWYGDMALSPHLALFVREGPLDAVVTWGEPIPFDAAADRKRATAQAEMAVRSAVRSAALAPSCAEPAATRHAFSILLRGRSA